MGQIENGVPAFDAQKEVAAMDPVMREALAGVTDEQIAIGRQRFEDLVHPNGETFRQETIASTPVWDDDMEKAA